MLCSGARQPDRGEQASTQYSQDDLGDLHAWTHEDRL